MNIDVNSLEVDDVVDSRDVLALQEELKGEVEFLKEEIAEAEDDTQELEQELEQKEEDLEDVSDFVEELEGYGDFAHGATLINEDHFVTYCEEYIRESYDIPSFLENHIDWDSLADEMEIDYTQADFRGATFYMRA